MIVTGGAQHLPPGMSAGIAVTGELIRQAASRAILDAEIAKAGHAFGGCIRYCPFHGMGPHDGHLLRALIETTYTNAERMARQVDGQ